MGLRLKIAQKLRENGFGLYLKKVISVRRPRYERMFVFEKNVSEFKDVKTSPEVNLRIATSIEDVGSLVAQREPWYLD